ncbi:hypothetical protein [Pyramidobacter piscolens]|uniref:hypothetical protein n=1 Tax=Pyramidobacter piscolens TaxID=638849 RepID=UPI002AAFB239|nr:hypothetical protein [Pyramidobacter piscolens]
MTPNFVGAAEAASAPTLTLKKSFIAKSAVLQAVIITHSKDQTWKSLDELSENCDYATPEGRAEHAKKQKVLYMEMERHDAQLDVLARILDKAGGSYLESAARRILEQCGGFENFCRTKGLDADGTDLLDEYIETEYSLL